MVLLAAAAVPLVLGPGLLAAPAAAAEPCVGVIVDARLLGGGVHTGCAKGDPDSGLDALATAGFDYAFAPRIPGFVCQIDAAPECRSTGPTTYWSYWYRSKGSRTWVYSAAGAGSHDPAPGSTEAWVWQDGGRREPPDVALTTICPQVARSRSDRATPSSTPRTARSSPTSQAARTSQAAPSPDSSAPSTPSDTSATAPAGVPPSPTAPAAPTAEATPEAASSTDGAVPAGDRADRTPWTGVVLGGGLVAVLGAAALRRSRRSGDRP